MIKKFLNPKGHQNHISGSKVTAILLKWWILPIGGTSARRVCACNLRSRLFITCFELSKENILSKWCFADHESLQCSLDLCQQSAWSH